MYLSNLKIWNFRKFGRINEDIDLAKPNLNVDFNKGVNLLAGENDSGKSSIIDAIKLVLRTHSIEWVKIEDDDFYQDSRRFRIECIFRDLKDNEAKNFVEWIGLEKQAEPSGSIETLPYLRLLLDAQRTPERVLPYEIKAGPDPEGRIISGE